MTTEDLVALRAMGIGSEFVEGDRIMEAIEVRVRRQSERQDRMFWKGNEYAESWVDTEQKFLIDGLLPYGYLAILGGTSKSGKSCLATALAMAVANGDPFLGMKTEQSPILWCANEETRRERMEVMQHYPAIPEGFHITHDRPYIDDPDDIELLGWWVEKTGAKLIVIDPLFGAMRGSLADGGAARDAMMRLKSLCFETETSILVIHHLTKDASSGLSRERFAESNQLLATASMDLLMDSRTKSDGSREIRIMGRGRGEFANRNWLIRSESPVHFELIWEGESGATKSRLKSDAILSALAELGEPLTSEEIGSVCEMPLQSVRNLIVPMLKAGEIVVAGKEGKTRRFSVPGVVSKDQGHVR